MFYSFFMKRAHVWISGRVQGVWFRAHTRDKAMELGIKGWVRNLPDGRVEAVFEGEEEQVKKMIEWCYVGSPLAKVDDVQVKWEEPRNEFDFIIKY